MDPAPPTTVDPWRVYLLVAGAILLATLNFSVVFVAFGDISEEFAADGTTVSWTLTAFSITTAALIVPGGWLADRYGRKRIFLVGFSLFLVGSALVALAPTVETLIAARVVQAAGLAMETPASLALVLDAFPTDRRATAVGAMGAVGGVAAAIGPVVGGALVDSFGWRVTFGLNVPLGIVVLLAVARRLPGGGPGRRTAGRPDLVGAALLVAGVAALALGIVQSDQWGVADPRTVGALAASVVFLAALVVRSATVVDPILHLALFRDHDFRLGSSLSFLLAGNFGGTFLAFLTFFQAGWGLSLFRAGVAVALIPLIGGPMSLLAGRIADRHGQRAVVLPGALAMAAAGAWMWSAASTEQAVWTLWLPVGVLYAVGVGLAHAACQSAALATVTPDRLGIGGAMNRIFQDIGNTVSVAVVIALLARAGDDPVAGIRSVMVLMVVTMLVSAAAASFLRGRGRAGAARLVAEPGIA